MSQIEPKVLAELNRQMNYELAASHAYLAMSNWLDLVPWEGFAKFFKKQSGEERGHADRIMAYILERNSEPKISAIPAPKSEFKSVLEIARQAQSMERSNTAGIHACYEAAIKANDYATQVMLQWFINEQVEEEKWADDMVDKVEMAECMGAMFQLDRHIVKE